MNRPRVDRVRHLSIVVPRLDRALALWRDALGVHAVVSEDPDTQIREAVLAVGDLELRLRQATDGPGDDPGLQIGLDVTVPDESATDATGAGRGASDSREGAPRPRAGSRLVQADDAGPVLELFETRAPGADLLPARSARAAARGVKRVLPASRGRGAKPHLPPSTIAPVKTAKAPRPSVRPRGTVSRGGKKK